MPLSAPVLPEIPETTQIPSFTTTTPQIAVLSESGGIYCNCVTYIRSKVPNLPKGLFLDIDPLALPPNSIKPEVGSIVIFTYGHLAYVEAVTAKRIIISETNKSPCKYGERILDKDDPTIVGYRNSTQSG